MTVVYIICFLLMAFGIIGVLELTPEKIGEDISSLLDGKKSLRDRAMTARGKKRTNKIVLWLDKIRRALNDTGREKSFGVACAIALLLMIFGAVFAVVIGNAYLAPIFAIATTEKVAFPSESKTTVALAVAFSVSSSAYAVRVHTESASDHATFV